MSELDKLRDNNKALRIGSVSLPNQKRVMFKFDDDEPIQLNSIFEGAEFIIKLKEGKIKFENGGKSFELYIE